VSAGPQLFRFVQFEYPWLLGPEPGKYVVRDLGRTDASHVLVLATLGAPERRRLGKRRGARTAPAEPETSPVPTTRVTVVPAEPLADEAAGRAWLLTARQDEHAERELADALSVLTRAVRAHRLTTADAGLPEPRRDHALVVRLGYGSGDQVIEGRYLAAVELAPTERKRRRRTQVLHPQQRLATLLGGHQEPLICEELTLRARADLDAGRTRQAALQLRVAFEAALMELDGSASDQRLGELRERRSDVGAAANAALQGPLDGDSAKAVEATLDRLEAALRAHAAGRE